MDKLRITMMKNFWFVTAIVASFFIGRFSIDHATTFQMKDDIRLASNENLSTQKNESTESVQTNLKLADEIKQLKQELSRRQNLAIPKEEIPKEIEANVNYVIEANNALTDAQEFTKQLSTDGNNVFQQIKEKFNQESVDQNWAKPQQQRIDSWLKSRSELANFSAEDITCKTTSCRIIFPIRSIEMSDEIAQAISKTAQQSGDIIKSSIIYDHSIAGSLGLYIAR